MSVLTSSPTTILIATETLAISNPLSDTLSTAGFEVEIVTDGETLLEMAQKVDPDLILLEPELSGMDGYTLCQHLKTSPLTQSIPIIFVGFAEKSLNQSRAIEVGADDYILEPCLLQEVLMRVKNQLTIRNLQKKMREQKTHQPLFFGGRDSGGKLSLLATLQRQLHHQAKLLHQKNIQLQQEIRERQQTQEALKAEQEKAERLLLSILPQALVQKLKQEPGAVAQRFDDVTILFADIVGFTPLASRLPPLELVNLLNEIFSSFDRLADYYGLEKIKTIGDAYMVAGGVPIPRSDHVEAVMEMAIAMRGEIRRFTREDGTPLQLRIGINTGTVIAGVLGIRKLSYDLWGDAVNVASRMESQGIPGKIQVTEQIYQHLQDKYQFEKWGTVNIKGKGRMTTYLYVGNRNADKNLVVEND